MKRLWMLFMYVLVPFVVLAQWHRGVDVPSINMSQLEMPTIRGADIVLVYDGFITLTVFCFFIGFL